MQVSSEIPDANHLANSHCKAKVKALEPEFVKATVSAALPNWQIDWQIDWQIESQSESLAQDLSSETRGQAKAILRTFQFENFYGVMAFLNSIATMIHREDHHPTITAGFKNCQVRWDTHSVNGVSRNDLICAAKCDRLYESLAK